LIVSCRVEVVSLPNGGTSGKAKVGKKAQRKLREQEEMKGWAVG
jgi:hypothetical protein